MEEIVVKLDKKTMSIYSLDETYYVGSIVEGPEYYRPINKNTRAEDGKPIIEADLSTFIELKQAGFTAGDIIEMYRQKMI